MSETNCMCTVCDRREVLAQPECLKQDWQFECLKQTVSETDWVLTHKQVFHPKDFYSNIPSTKDKCMLLSVQSANHVELEMAETNFSISIDQ